MFVCKTFFFLRLLYVSYYPQFFSLFWVGSFWVFFLVRGFNWGGLEPVARGILGFLGLGLFI